MNILNEVDLGRAIRQRRKDLGWDQASLATRAGVGRQWVVEVEKGKARAEVGLVLRTLRTLGLSLDLSVQSQPPGPSHKPASVSELQARLREIQGRQTKGSR